MSQVAATQEVQNALREVLNDHHGRLLSALIANLRDFQLAEDSLQDALITALGHWEENGLPNSPAALKKASQIGKGADGFDTPSVPLCPW